MESSTVELEWPIFRWQLADCQPYEIHTSDQQRQILCQLAQKFLFAKWVPACRLSGDQIQRLWASLGMDWVC
jgi:hypothetical protein